MTPEIDENWALMHINKSLLLLFGITNEDFKLPNYNAEIFHIPNEPHVSEDDNSKHEFHKCIAFSTKKQREMFRKNQQRFIR